MFLQTEAVDGGMIQEESFSPLERSVQFSRGAAVRRDLLNVNIIQKSFSPDEVAPKVRGSTGHGNEFLGNMTDQEIQLPEILIVDDDDAVRELLFAVLSESYTCLVAASGDEALRRLETHLPDLVISDINMPGMSGLELIPKVYSIAPEIVVMMISGNRTIDAAIEAIRAGAFDFIKKPFELDHVEIAVRRALNHHSLLVEKRRHDEQLEDLVAERTKQLNYLAYYDALTGLPNRAMFDERLTEAIAKAGAKRQVAAMLVSPDRFKDIRDTLGHLVGDQIIREFGRRLAASARSDAFVARFGADEFALMMTVTTSQSDAIDVTGDIFEALRKPFAVETHELFVTAAIGISLYPNDGADGQSIMKNAGVALSRAKTNGSTSHSFYTADMQAAALRRLTLENDLRVAIEKGELEAHYQPKLDVRDNRIVGMEALIRWRHPEFGLISPLDFIPIAEESGLIVEIGEWILREACRQTSVWREAGYKLQIAVNVSAGQFDIRLADAVHRIIDETGLDATCLNLEMTESAIMKNAEFAIKTLHELKTIGIRISIDDFGTGYSSLGQLKNLPIDVLKIDKSFINDITTNKDDASLVIAVIGLAHNLNLKVVAEGVETDEQLEFLNSFGCDEYQGYLFSRPLTADEFTRLLTEKN